MHVFGVLGTIFPSRYLICVFVCGRVFYFHLLIYRSIVPLGYVVVKMTITHFFLKRMHVFCVVGAIIPFRYSTGVSVSRVSYVYIRSMADNSQQITLWLPCSPTNMEVQPSLGNYFLSVVTYKRLDELFILSIYFMGMTPISCKPP